MPSDPSHHTPEQWKEIQDRVQTELEQLNERKRLAYTIAVACAVVIFLLSWIIRQPEDIFIARLYPLFAVVLAAMFPLIYKRLLPLQIIETLLLIILGLMIMARLAWHFFASDPVSNHLLMLAGGHYWAVAVFIVGCFVILDHKLGLAAGSAVILVSAAIAGTGLALQWRIHGPQTEPLIYLVRIHLFLLLILGLTSVGTTMRDKLKNALVRAEVLNKWATTDMLTGLPNRRLAEGFIRQQINASSRYGRGFWIISADLDNFKEVNDTLGHAAGDAVLKEVGQILLDNIRESDLAARWGGEEFLIVATSGSPEGIYQLAERCRRAIASRPLAGVNITATLGVTGYRPGETLEDVLCRADQMLYSGKDAGRNRVVVESC
ncbi:MAG: GGDEF domain-containing protein [Desulfonatronovibrionaceae bacterium]